MEGKEQYLAAFGSRVRAARERAKLTQEELSERCNCGYEGGRGTISKIECGKSDVPISHVVAIADALNTTVAYLLSIEKEDISVERAREVGRLEGQIDLLKEQVAGKQSHPTVPPLATPFLRAVMVSLPRHEDVPAVVSDELMGEDVSDVWPVIADRIKNSDIATQDIVRDTAISEPLLSYLMRGGTLIQARERVVFLRLATHVDTPMADIIRIKPNYSVRVLTDMDVDGNIINRRTEPLTKEEEASLAYAKERNKKWFQYDVVFSVVAALYPDMGELLYNYGSLNDEGRWHLLAYSSGVLNSKRYEKTHLEKLAIVPQSETGT
jgi:transcriptional regulator with XRE-family HTH domain